MVQFQEYLSYNNLLPNQIRKLIDSCEDINNPERDIKYDYFKENQEHIQQQSICFCFENIDVLVKSVSSCNEIFKDNKPNKNINQKNLDVIKYLRIKNMKNLLNFLKIL